MREKDKIVSLAWNGVAKTQGNAFRYDKVKLRRPRSMPYVLIGQQQT